MIVKTVRFGRIWRYECDLARPGCHERIAQPAGEPPGNGWEVRAGETVVCPACAVDDGASVDARALIDRLAGLREAAADKARGFGASGTWRREEEERAAAFDAAIGLVVGAVEASRGRR